jgi:hypothetical protein
MGFLATLFGCGKSNGRFVSEKAFQKNLARQVAMAPQALEQLRKHGVTEQITLKLEYFFYTDTAEKAVVLAGVLTRKGYTVMHGPSLGRDKTFIITGWTTPMTMDESTVIEWIRGMCWTGFNHDCEFDGWGTTPKQE